MCKLFAYCSAIAAEVTSDAGLVSRSFFFHELGDLMNPLKRSSVYCSIDSGEPFALFAMHTNTARWLSARQQISLWHSIQTFSKCKRIFSLSLFCNVPRNGPSKR
ncbi:MAG: hypothetical protein ACKPKO_31985, partial [Candidatus Fonsibacter sp.]